nr:PREDICTED: aminopeptidase N-like isoform X1 [Linepithema humile]
MALRNITLNIKLIFIVIIFFSIPQFINSDTEVNYHSLNYTSLVPLHYGVKIELDFERNVLFGECNITINITRQMKNISIPSINYAILKIDMINSNDSQIINVPQYAFIDETHIYIDFINSSVSVLSPGTYILKLMYTRNIFDDENDLGSFNDERGEKVLIETGVEVIRAQQIFPCWYESAFETTFTVSIKHHKTYTALSNMFINMTEYDDENNMMWTHFDKSPFMSIQHLTIVITTLTKISSLYKNITIWCRKNMIKHVLFALDVVQEVVKFLQLKSLTKIEKIDYVVIWDKQHSNIERMGLILHREEDITYSKTLDSITHKIEVANLLTRQIISVWYHDVLWPIEGFTTYLTAHILGKIPSLSYINDLFVVQVQQESLRVDIPSYTNPQLYNINELEMKIRKTFLNYVKPYVLLHVLQHVISEEYFWESIIAHAYFFMRLKQTEDLWQLMQYTVNKRTESRQFNVTKYIDTWMKNNLYPVLYVERSYTNDTILISYLSSDYIVETMQLVPVLVTFTTQKNGNTYQKDFWLESSGIKTEQLGFHQTDCLIVNIEQNGYYRVNYNTEGWLILVQCLNSKNYIVHPLNQAQIIDDAFYFLKQKLLSYTMFWNVTNFLSDNTNYIAWYPMIKAFEYMACTCSFNNAIRLMQNMKIILNGVLQVIGYTKMTNESTLTHCLREEVAKWACILDVAECRKAATLQLIKDLQSPVQDNRVAWKEWKYCSGLMSANYTIWNHTFQRWETTSDNRILDYLTCCNDFSIIITYLNQTIGLTDKSIIKEQDIRVNIVLLTVAKHIKNNVVLNFILKCLKNKELKFSRNRDVDLIVTLIVIITNIHDINQLQEVTNFTRNLEEYLFNAVKKKIAKRILENAEQIKNCGSFITQ